MYILYIFLNLFIGILVVVTFEEAVYCQLDLINFPFLFGVKLPYKGDIYFSACTVCSLAASTRFCFAVCGWQKCCQCCHLPTIRIFRFSNLWVWACVQHVNEVPACLFVCTQAHTWIHGRTRSRARPGVAAVAAAWCVLMLCGGHMPDGNSSIIINSQSIFNDTKRQMCAPQLRSLFAG